MKSATYLNYEIDHTAFLTEGYEPEMHLEAFKVSACWNDMKARFPLLFEVYCAIASCPASSIPAEEMFSLGGLIVTKMRTSLCPTKVSQLMFLEANRRRRVSQALDFLSSFSRAREDEDSASLLEMEDPVMSIGTLFS